MTRTARAVYPRALTRDRSESKSGLDKSATKHGAGPHNWGSLHDEAAHELYGAQDSYEDEYYSADEAYGERDDTTTSTISADDDEGFKNMKTGRRASVSVTETDRANARSFRTRSFKGRQDIDLASIARTSSAVSSSPPTSSILNSPTNRTKLTV